LSSEVDYFRQKYENLLKINDSLLHANDSIKRIKTVYSPEVQKYSNGTRLESTNFEYRTPQRKSNQATVVQNRGKKNLKNANISTKNQQGDPDRGVDLSLLDDTGNGYTDIIDDGEDDKPFMSVEQMPRFPGGEEALNEWLLKNTTYPAAARENGIDGTVIVLFTVDRTGDIKDAHVVRKVHPLLDDAAMSAIRKLPKWEAGQQNGKAVPVLINLPFRFGMKE
jgi:TonB family protein